MIQKFVHEMPRNVFARRLLEVADGTQVDRVPFGRPEINLILKSKIGYKKRITQDLNGNITRISVKFAIKRNTV